jgi:hypothetical protein
VARQGIESTGPLLRCPLVREHNRPLASLSASRPEASAGRPVPRRRANKDGIDTLLVAAVVTENGADPSESLRDRAAAVEADVFRFLPRQSHHRPLPDAALRPRRSCRSGGSLLLSLVRAMKLSRADRGVVPESGRSSPRRAARAAVVGGVFARAPSKKTRDAASLLVGAGRARRA